MMKNENLDRLVKEGILKEYHYVNVSDEGVEEEESINRNTERVRLTFSGGKTLVIDTFCPGCSQNSVLFFNGK